MDMIRAGQNVLSQVRQVSPKAQAEVFLIDFSNRVSEWSEGKPENQVLSQSRGLSLRLVHEGRLGFGYTNCWEPEAITSLVRKAASASQSTEVDPLMAIPETVPTSPAEDLDLVDESLTSTSWETRWAFLPGLEEEVKKRDKRIAKLLRGSYREGHIRTSVVNSRGMAATSPSTSVSFGMACVATQPGETQIGYAFQGARHYGDLNPSWVINRAVEQAVALLDGKRIASGRYDLILDPFVAAEILELLASALRADQVQKGKSFLASKMGEQVGAPCLNLIDNGRLARGLGSSPFDAEGHPTQKTCLLHRGQLQGLLYDSYTARKAHKTSTGNSGRSSYKGVPEPQPTNFYLEPSSQPPETLWGSVQSGIYVRSVMGLHTVDTISGEYSLGLMGQLIQKGQRTHAVRGITMAGNLLDLLKNVEAVGSDLVFSGSIGSPTLWVRDVSIGGHT